MENLDKTLSDFQPQWEQLVYKAFDDFSSLSASERIWFTVECLINDVDNGGLISHYYNAGANFNKETVEDLDFLGFDKVSNLLKQINTLFPDGVVSTDLLIRNDVISSWPDNEYDALLAKLDQEFYLYEDELESKLVEHIQANIITL